MYQTRASALRRFCAAVEPAYGLFPFIGVGHFCVLSNRIHAYSQFCAFIFRCFQCQDSAGLHAFSRSEFSVISHPSQPLIVFTGSRQAAFTATSPLKPLFLTLIHATSKSRLRGLDLLTW